jgi:hypothetical protein
MFIPCVSILQGVRTFSSQQVRQRPKASSVGRNYVVACQGSLLLQNRLG